MNESQRQKRVSSLIKAELSPLLIHILQESVSGLVTITRVEMSKDLRKAYVYLSLFGSEEREKALGLLEEKKGFLRKSIATKTKLKYNPMLIFSLDTTPNYEEKIDKIIRKIKNEE